MAGWVVDTTGGQNDPNDGNWAHGADVINGLKCFGNGQTPSSALWDLRNNFSQSQMVFPELECESEPNLSRIFVPKYEVFAEAPEWLDNHYGNAEDIEAYMGYDGQGNAIYANWTTDAGDLGGCVSILFFTGVGSREHSFFQLGWAIHLVQDGTLTPHTTDDSFDYYNAFDHQEMEGLIGKIISEPLRYGPICIPAALPALTQSEFQDLYPWPLPNPCGGYSLTNPTVYFRPNWASGYLARDPREGVAHAYIRNTTEILTNYAPWLISDCVDIERQNDEKDVEDVGFLNVLQLDTCVKVTAGLIHHFLNDVGLWEGELQDGVNGPFTDPQLPYELLGDVTVPVGRTLTLGPGLRVKFNPGRKITALGTLTVDGASAPVRLVSSSDPNRAVVIRSRLVLSNGGELKLP